MSDPGAQHEDSMEMLRHRDEPVRWTRGVWVRLALAFGGMLTVVALVLLLGR